MALSKECYEYHLTPDGWVEGTFHRDFGKDIVPTPENRVLTIGFYEILPSAFAEAFTEVKELWKSDDADLVKRLRRKFGRYPEEVEGRIQR